MSVGFVKVSVESQYTATAMDVRIVHIEREQKRVGERSDVYRVSLKSIIDNLTYDFIVKVEVKQKVQHEYERTAVGSCPSEVRPRLYDAAVLEPHIDEIRNGNVYAMYHRRQQTGGYGCPGIRD